LDWLTWLFLGVLQGLTEFLPVSSSGHLVLAQEFLGVQTPGVLLEVTVHAATAAAVVVLFARELWRMLAAVAAWFRPGRRGPRGRDWSRENVAWRGLAANLLVATAATALIGFGLEPLFRVTFEEPRVAAVMLLVTGLVLLLSSRFASGRRTERQIRPSDAVAVGVAQGLAILPGLSRSGMTIVAGLSRGLEGRSAARFSFLLSLPAIAGAGLVEVSRAGDISRAAAPGLPLGGLALAFVAAFVSGVMAMVVLARLVERGRLHRFAWYCWALGAAALAWGALV